MPKAGKIFDIIKQKQLTATNDKLYFLLGIPDMINGMEYHFDKYHKVIQGLQNGEFIHSGILVHGTNAFLNRMGQFGYLLKSTNVQSLNLTYSHPNINRIEPFRMKYSAHRSIDDPRNDTIDTQKYLAIAMLFPSVNKNRDPSSQPSDTLPNTADYFKNKIHGFQADVESNGRSNPIDRTVTFYPEEDMPIIIQEASAAAEAILAKF